MSEWRLVRLNFGRNPTHFGETGIGLESTCERVRSDTLFGAWMGAYAKTFGKKAVEDLLGQFETAGEPPFRVSSTFVYRHQGGTYTDYLPVLADRPTDYPADDLAFAKTFRKLKYLPLSVWQRWYQGSGFSKQDQEDLKIRASNPNDDSTELAKAGCFSYTEAFKTHELPKVAIDRTTRATNFYHTGYVQFGWRMREQPDPNDWNDSEIEHLGGLYFLLEVPDSDDLGLEDRLYQSLGVLGEGGLGGERSSGAGRFFIQTWDPLSTNWQAIVNPSLQTNHHALMGLFWQKGLSPEWLGDSARYTILERGGWISSPFSGRQLRRKMVRMFAEGSIFPNKPAGELANVTPDGFKRHQVYRSGIPISVPVLVKSPTEHLEASA